MKMIDFFEGDLVECAMFGPGVIEHIGSGSTPILVKFDSGVTMPYDFEGASAEYHALPTLGFRGTKASIVTTRPVEYQPGNVLIDGEGSFYIILDVNEDGPWINRLDFGDRRLSKIQQLCPISLENDEVTLFANSLTKAIQKIEKEQ